MVSAIILAAGSSSRMMGMNKQLEEIGGVPVFVMSALKFQKSAKVGEIIISAPENRTAEFETLARENGITKLKTVTSGGKTRFLSTAKALEMVSPEADYIAVHDGARPLISTAEIDKVIADAEKYGGAIAASGATDTVKIADKTGVVKTTPERSTLWYAQTPQVFDKAMYFSCVEELIRRGEKIENVTDDSSIFELCGKPVKLTEISGCNMKITRPADLTAARAIYDEQKGRDLF